MTHDTDLARVATPTKFRTILTDPPWNVPSQHGRRGTGRHYPLMTIEEIGALRVDQLAADDAHLWRWVTNAAWREQVTGMEAWGFSYRSCLTWVKPRLGLGRYLRNQTEHLLPGVRGQSTDPVPGQVSWLYAPVQAHSHEPEEVYAVIERCSPGPHLELFARRKRPGWHAWGDEVSCDVAL